MLKVTLGSTGFTVNKNGFGALPVQRVDMATAKTILRSAYENGVTYFDTARSYSDSEEKMGNALADVRGSIIIATKTPSSTVEGFWQDLATSLRLLKTDYIDVYQFHNPAVCPKPGDGSGLYEAMREAKAQGKIRAIGITNHRLPVAREAVESGLYEVLQFPFSYLAGQQDLDLLALCEKNKVGFVAMKALSGGLLTNAAAAYAWMAQHPAVLPIWGIQRLSELEEFIAFQTQAPRLDEAMRQRIEEDRSQLAGAFCRGCGYCQPCPAGIDIGTCARMSLLLRRSPAQQWLGEAGQEKMGKVKGCIHCNQCASRCPYGLNPPVLLEKNYQDYLAFIAAI